MAEFVSTRSKEKSLKGSLRHLNDCFGVFKELAKQQNITEDNESQYIRVLLHSYITSNYIIEDDKINKYKINVVYNFEKDEESESIKENIKNIRI